LLLLTLWDKLPERRYFSVIKEILGSEVQRLAVALRRGRPASGQG